MGLLKPGAPESAAARAGLPLPAAGGSALGWPFAAAGALLAAATALLLALSVLAGAFVAALTGGAALPGPPFWMAATFSRLRLPFLPTWPALPPPSWLLFPASTVLPLVFPEALLAVFLALSLSPCVISVLRRYILPGLSR